MTSNPITYLFEAAPEAFIAAIVITLVCSSGALTLAYGAGRFHQAIKDARRRGLANRLLRQMQTAPRKSHPEAQR